MGQARVEGQSGAPRKLLIVDDEERFCRLLERFFALKGYQVRSVCGGEEALALAAVFQPDVALLDLLMPGMSGVDTLKGLKQLNPSIKVLVISAADLEEVARGAIKLGADSYVCKPADLPQLERLVNGFCPATN